MEKSTSNLLFLLLAALSCVITNAKTHSYKKEEPVPFYVNKIGPYTNPSETYEYYSLPFCAPETIQHKHAAIGEHLKGDHKVNSKYDIRFQGK